MDSIPGDQWIGEYARWLRVHEAKLGDVAASTVAAKRNAAAKTVRDAPPSTLSSTLWNVVTLGTASTPTNGSSAATAASTLAARPMLLRQNPHNLYYLLIRFEALGLPVGSLDTKIPVAARPTSYFSFVAATAADKSRDDTMSMSSMRSRISVVSSSFSSSLSWFGASSSKPDPSRDVKYIYSCFTKIPSLRIGPIPARKLIQDFEDCPGQSAVPLDVFKNLQMLELDDVDPRTLLGWDRVCIQLRSLTCKRSNIEDLTDLLVDLVVLDTKRRHGEKVDLRRLRRAPAAASDADEELSAFVTTASNTDVEDDSTRAANLTSTSADQAASGEAMPTLPQDLPSLAWHFLKYLNLSSNNLTFIPVEPLLCLPGLTNLDLSSNLLNVVPPSLSHLPALTSLNISDNLIDSVLGIYDALPAIRVLNLAKNRLESLCGVERLYTLQRIDLRGNAIYEAGEVGRLAPLAAIAEVWVKDNPLVEELVDYRVECFAEFAQEGRSVMLDGEAPGFFEKQRIAERVPNAAALFALAGSNESRSKRAEASGTERASRKAAEQEENEAQLAKDVATSSRNATVVKNVRHRMTSRSAAKAENARGRSELLDVPDGDESRSRSASRNREGPSSAQQGGGGGGAARRRNQRVVELDSSPRKPFAGSSRQGSLTESDRIKQAARSGNSSAAMESPEPGSKSKVQTKHTDENGGSKQNTQAEGAQEGEAGVGAEGAVHGAMLFALPPGLTLSSESDSPKKAGQSRTFTSRRNPIGSSTLGRKSAARPLASDLFATGAASSHDGSNTHEKAAEAETKKDAAEPADSAAVMARQRIARPRTGSAAALARRSRVTTSLYDPDLSAADVASAKSAAAAAPLGGVAEEPTRAEDQTSTAPLNSGNNRSDAFRRRIEALKSEVGDDWLRLLARGDGVAGDRNSALLLSSVTQESATQQQQQRSVRDAAKKTKKASRPRVSS